METTKQSENPNQEVRSNISRVANVIPGCPFDEDLPAPKKENNEY